MNLTPKAMIKHLTIVLACPVLVALSLASSSRAVGTAPEDASGLYNSKCAACHAKDGSGDTPAGKGLKVRDLRSEEVQGQSDDKLFDIIAKGKGKMPGYESSLGHENIHQIIAYLRDLAKKK